MQNNRQTDIMHWSMFWRIDPDLHSKIKYVQIDVKQNAFFVTDTDEVYGIGSNSDGLINGGSGACNEPFRIDALCGKKIVSITIGHSPCVFALTSDGDMYVWGKNSEGQLCMNNYSNLPTPKLCEEIKTHRLKQVASGCHHTLMLTNDGEVFACGFNNYGQLGISSNYDSKINQPSLVHRLPADRPVVRIACSIHSSFAIVTSGHTFSWGNNGNGELGLNHKEKRCLPERVAKEDDLIFKSIACGSSHTIALTAIGHIYCWGNNSQGQLGFADKSPVIQPKQLNIEAEIFYEIGAHHSSNFNAALSWEGDVYVWGLEKGPSIIKPLLTNFSSINQAFALMADIPVTVTAIKPGQPEVSVTEYLAEQLDNCSFSDVTFIFGEKKLFAHSTILRIRSEYLRSMLSSNWEKKEQIEIPINGYSYDVYQAYLHFLYTGEVEISPADAIDLLQLADEYLEEVLKKKCESFIMRNTKLENVCMNYMKAKQFHATELEEFCFNYAITYLNATSQTDGFKLLPGELVKQFIGLAGSRGIFKGCIHYKEIDSDDSRAPN